jgi:D-aspartate ligase
MPAPAVTALSPSARPPHIVAIDTSTPVVVLSAQNYGCLGIFRSLGRLGVPVFAVDLERRRPASHSRFLRGRFVFDIAGSAPEAIVDHLLHVGSIIGRRAILIPTWDETAVLVSEHHAALSEVFLLPEQPPGLAASLASKKAMHAVARAHGIPTPGAAFPADIGDVRAFAAASAFPIVIKGIEGGRLKRRTGRSMAIARDHDQLEHLYVELEDPDDPNLMLQEYIPGGDEAVWMFNGYFDRDSACVVGFTGRKLRQTPPYAGVTSLGVCLRNEAVEETTVRWMKELGYRGVLDIGYRFDARDGSYKVLDVNPRIGATARLFVAQNGMDVARALYLDMTGQPVPTAPQREGRRWMVEDGDLHSALTYIRDGRLTASQWARSLLGVREGAYFALDDPAPLWKVCTEFVRRRTMRRRSPIGRAARRLRSVWPRSVGVKDDPESRD